MKCRGLPESVPDSQQSSGSGILSLDRMLTTETAGEAGEYGCGVVFLRVSIADFQISLEMATVRLGLGTCGFLAWDFKWLTFKLVTEANDEPVDGEKANWTYLLVESCLIEVGSSKKLQFGGCPLGTLKLKKLPGYKRP
ncbi:unnamed protein product [Linum trigynum]|uniref:Uncharacterized protein n=1 Tax=Linum trigynum TaxID=586398 RepID=A0AAV2DHY4_9ROSI